MGRTLCRATLSHAQGNPTHRLRHRPQDHGKNGTPPPTPAAASPGESVPSVGSWEGKGGHFKRHQGPGERARRNWMEKQARRPEESTTSLRGAGPERRKFLASKPISGL